MIDALVAVCSRTFSQHKQLRQEMEQKFSNIRFNSEGLKLEGEFLVSFLKDCQGTIIALEKIDENIISKLPKLRIISKYGVGLDNIDQTILERYHVKLGWTGGVNRRSVSELALGFMFNLLRKINLHHSNLCSGVWENLGGNLLSGKTVGIIGCGYIGKDISKILKVFGCNILINDILPMKEHCLEIGAKQVSKEEIYKNSDIVSLHVPYTSDTHHLINATVFELMKPEAILINTSRGNVVDEFALENALRRKKIRGAGMDVFSKEPPGVSPLFACENFIATPHLGGGSQESILDMGRVAIDNLYNIMDGK